jgi:acetate kinase|tara:strand:- start:112 stop:1254 length:1143 start_codon:yes stop_codon:yes gene_type:complete
MRVLVINAGSSSVKIGIFDGAEHIYKHSLSGLEHIEDALDKIPGILKDNGYDDFDAVGHRIAHGGASFRDASVIDATVINAIEACVPLAPLHNPPNLKGITLAKTEWPGIPQVAVFDTAFHQSMPDHAVLYAVPKEWRDKGVRHYGFHGTSHKYIMQRVAEELKSLPESVRVISCHLGNGASVCAIDRGRSVDTSMGMTALGGPVMGTRSGDVDPGLCAFLHRTLCLSPDEVESLLYHDSGLKALAGTGDMQEIEDRAAQGDIGALLALDVFSYSLRRYIGAYAAVMNGVDVLAFTGGIGENSVAVRSRICAGLEFMGLHFDEKKNAAVNLSGYEAPQIQKGKSQVKIIVTQTREQWMIARDVERILKTRTAKQKKEARA